MQVENEQYRGLFSGTDLQKMFQAKAIQLIQLDISYP